MFSRSVLKFLHWFSTFGFRVRQNNLLVRFLLQLLGLDICSDIMVGDQLKRGISGGQKKRVTTGKIPEFQLTSYNPRFVLASQL